jgi:hypothetical protein
MSIIRACILILCIVFIGVLLAYPPASQAGDFCDPFENCDSDADCGQGYCKNQVCQCDSDPGICSDRCPDRGLCYPDGSCQGDIFHIDDCRGIATGGGGGVISYCALPDPPVCDPNQGNACQACNACGMCGNGTIQCNGSCDAVQPPDALCGNMPIGSSDAADCSSLWGWSFDPDYSGSVNVEIFTDGPAGGGGTYQGKILANQSRPDIDIWAQGAGYSPPNRTNSGWSWSIPGSLKDGNAHDIYAYAENVDSSGALSGTNPLLWNNPRSVICTDPPTGTITSATCSNTTGIATDNQGSPVAVAIYDGQADGGGVQIGAGSATPNYTVGYTAFTNGQTHPIYAYGQDIPSGTWHQLGGMVPVTCMPTVSLSANPTTVDIGQSSTLTWSVQNAVNCTASPGGWFNPASLVNGVADSSGSSGPLTDSTTFTLTCTNAIGQSQSASVTVGVNIPPPVGSITNVTDTDYCAAGPGMSIDWQYQSAGRPIGAYQVQVLDMGGNVIFDTGKTTYLP